MKSVFYSNLVGVKKARFSLHLFSSLVSFSFCHSAAAELEGATIVSGDVELRQQGLETNIVQHSERAIINYESFSLAQGEVLNIQQPTEQSALLNRVIGSRVSVLNGDINANGQVFLINQNGIVLGQHSSLNVGSLVAATRDIADDNFLAKDYIFDGTGGSIENRGEITTNNAQFISDKFINSGSINVAEKLGFTSSSLVMIQLENSEIPFIVEEHAEVSRFDNSGFITANEIFVDASIRSSQNRLETVMNTGVLYAQTVAERNGKIHILAENADAYLGGVIKSGLDSAGSISADANRIIVAGELSADATAHAGSINIFAEESLLISDMARASANSLADGNGGELRFVSSNLTAVTQDALLEAKGGLFEGDGGFIEVSGYNYVDMRGFADASAVNGLPGEAYIDPIDITIQTGGGGIFINPSSEVWEWDAGLDIGTSTIDPTIINSFLASGTSVTIDTASGVGGAGDINFIDSIDLNGAMTGVELAIIADQSINISSGAGIFDSDPLTDESVGVRMIASGDILMQDGSFIRNGSGQVSLTASGSIQVAEISSSLMSQDSIVLSTSNELILPDTGFDIEHGLSITASSIRDSDASINLSADTAQIQLAGIQENLQINASFSELSFLSNGSNVVQINNDQSLNLLAFDVNGGAELNLSSGSLNIGNSINLDGINGSGLSFFSPDSISFADGVSIIDEDLSSMDDVNLSFVSMGDISFDTGGFMQTSGDIFISSDQEVQITNVQSDNVSETAVVIHSGADIRGGQGVRNDITADNGRIVLRAQNQIVGLAGFRFDISAESLDVETVGAGDINIRAFEDLHIVRAENLEVARIEVNGELTIPDSGLSAVGNLLRIVADDVVDGDRNLIFNADSLLLNLLAPIGPTSIDVDLNFLDVSTPNQALEITGANTFSFEDIDFNGSVLEATDVGLQVVSGGLSLNNLAIPIASNVNGDLSIQLLDQVSTLELADSSLTTSQNLSIDVGNLESPENTISFDTNELELNLRSQTQDIGLDLNVLAADIIVDGSANLNITTTQALELADLNSDGYSLQVNGGNLLVDVTGGDLSVSSSIRAIDTEQNGIREGTIELVSRDGNLIVSGQPELLIESLNDLDSGVNGGLGSPELHQTEQAGIYLHLGDSAVQGRAIVLGPSDMDQVIVSALGGDIIIDAAGLNSENIFNDDSLILGNEIDFIASNGGSSAALGRVLLGPYETIPEDPFFAGLGRSISVRPTDYLPQPVPFELLPQPVLDAALDLAGVSPLLINPENRDFFENQVAIAGEKMFGKCVSRIVEDTACEINKRLSQLLSKWTVGGELPNAY